MALKTLLPSFSHSTPLPPLPRISSEVIRTQVFTHRSFYARPTHVFEDLPEDPSPDNEKYEHLGDTVLGLVVTNLMWEMFPGLRVGPSTKLRAMIVGNVTLAEISVKYRLPDMLRLHPAQALSLRASVHIQADVFESFVGGLYIDQGLECVKPWLYNLFRPYAAEAYGRVRAQHGLPPSPPSTPASDPPVPNGDRATATTATSGNGSNGGAEEKNRPPPEVTRTMGHLALFNQHLQQSHRRVEWKYVEEPPSGAADSSAVDDKASAQAEDSQAGVAGGGVVVPGTPMWIVEVLVDGESFGRGRSNTKKGARNEAAKIGLARMGVVDSSLTPTSMSLPGSPMAGSAQSDIEMLAAKLENQAKWVG